MTVPDAVHSVPDARPFHRAPRGRPV